MSDFRSKVSQVPGPIGSTNRGNDTAALGPSVHVNLEMINGIILGYMSDTITPTIDDNGNTLSVPVLYGTPERWATVRKHGVLRDGTNDKLLTPTIMLRRTSVKEGQLVNPNNKYMYTTITNDWNQRNAYDRFAVQNGIRPSKNVRNIMIPDYMNLTYEVMMWTEYQAQMDALIEQINVENHEFWGNRNQYKFRVSIEEYTGDSELPATEDRVIRTQFTMIVAAYLLPERVVQNFKLSSTNQDTFTKKKVVFKSEVINDIEKIG
jgi:hypothetical protein